MAKVKNNVFYYLLAVVCATAFFVHETLPRDTQEVITARALHKAEKKERTKNLNELKELNFKLANNEIAIADFITAQKTIVQEYLVSSKKTDAAYTALKESKKEQRFFEFPSKYWFFGEFWAIGFLIYVIFNIQSRFRASSPFSKSKLFIDGGMLYCGLYYSTYLFINTQDFNPVAYKTSLVFVAGMLILGVYQLVKNKASLQKVIASLSRFIVFKGKELAAPENKTKYVEGYRDALKEGME